MKVSHIYEHLQNQREENVYIHFQIEGFQVTNNFSFCQKSSFPQRVKTASKACH